MHRLHKAMTLAALTAALVLLSSCWMVPAVPTEPPGASPGSSVSDEAPVAPAAESEQPAETPLASTLPTASDDGGVAPEAESEDPAETPIATP